jgi:hypothetical protein
MDGLVASPQDIDGVFTVPRFEHVVAKVTKCATDEGAYAFLIFDDEYDLAAAIFRCRGSLRHATA